MRVEIMAQNVKLLREERLWSQEDLQYATTAGGKTGVTLLTIRRIEDKLGLHNSTSRIAETLAAALGVDIEQLMVPILPKPYDVGGGLIMDLSSKPTADEMRASTEKLIEILGLK